MTHFSLNPGHVRVDQFKPGGKWYQTFQIDMSNYYDGRPGEPGSLIHDAVRAAILDELVRQNAEWVKSETDREGSTWETVETKHRSRAELAEGMRQWTWVVLDPYHVHSHPVSFPAEIEYDAVTRSYVPIRGTR